jgi:hypothetical protein
MDDEEEPTSSPVKKLNAPAVAEDTRPSHKGPIVDEFVVTERRGVCGSGGRMRGAGRNSLPAIQLLLYMLNWTPFPNLLPPSSCLKGSKYSRPYYFIRYHHFSSNTLVQDEKVCCSQSSLEEKNFTFHNSSNI